MNAETFKYLFDEYKRANQINYNDDKKDEWDGILNKWEEYRGKIIRDNDEGLKLSDLLRFTKDGADIIDIGAESTKPYSHAVDSEEQLSKLIPILKYIKENNINIPISIDTRSAQVAQECINFGASIINDVSGLEYDPEMAKIIAQNPEIKVIIQHCKGTPENMQDNPQYENLTDEIFKDLKSKIDYALSQGIKKENIILDPGIGFGKNREDNFEIIRRWQEFKTLECPIMIGISRKSMLGKQNSNEQKDIYTLALNSILINENIDYIRVHNVKLHKDFLNILP
jgi:dihydropteroate synthase